MTPKDKAKELVDKFSVVGLQQRNEGIACALIMCDELLCNSTFLLSPMNKHGMLLEAGNGL